MDNDWNVFMLLVHDKWINHFLSIESWYYNIKWKEERKGIEMKEVNFDKPGKLNVVKGVPNSSCDNAHTCM